MNKEQMEIVKEAYSMIGGVLEEVSQISFCASNGFPKICPYCGISEGEPYIANSLSSSCTPKLKPKIYDFTKKKDICECGHHTNHHSYEPSDLSDRLDCDICPCTEFKSKTKSEDRE